MCSRIGKSRCAWAPTHDLRPGPGAETLVPRDATRLLTAGKRIEQLEETLQDAARLFTLQRADERTADLNIFRSNGLLRRGIQLFRARWDGSIKPQYWRIGRVTSGAGCCILGEGKVQARQQDRQKESHLHEPNRPQAAQSVKKAFVWIVWKAFIWDSEAEKGQVASGPFNRDNLRLCSFSMAPTGSLATTSTHKPERTGQK